MVELAPSEQAFAKQAMRSGAPLPDRIANAPELQMGLQLYLQAFFDLDSERNNGEGLAPIPWMSVASYANAFEFDDEQREDLFFFITRMDSEHLKFLANKRKANAKKSK